MDERDVSFYLETNFPYWKNGSRTYVIPHCYKYKYPHFQEIEVMLNFRFSVLNEEKEALKGIFGNMKGDFAEHEVLNAFKYLCENEAQPAFIFHNFKWLNEKNIILQETDIIIVHRDLGIILVEIKSRRNNNAKNQLNKTEKLFKVLFKEVFKNEITSDNSFNVIKKVMAFPYTNTNNSSLTCPNGTTDYYNLGKSDLEKFEYFDCWWWDNMVGNTNSGDCKKIYDRLIPELFKKFLAKNNSKSSYNNLVIAETVHQLKTQSFLKDRKAHDQRTDNRLQLTCMMPNKKKIKCIDPHDVPVNVTDGKILQKIWDYITFEQCQVWKRNKQVICGPYGSGKTVLIQCKAATLACCGQYVLVIVPHHLVKNYWNFFKEVVEPDKHELIKLTSIKDFHKSFYEFEKLAKSRHVFVDELLYPTSGNPIVDLLFLDVLSYLLQESNYYVWIASHAHSVTKNMLFNENFESVLCLPFQFKRKLSEYFVFLRITMRTTKEIHDYKNRLEFNDFKHKFKSEDKDKAANDEFFQLLYINNILGHSISGFPVETISYSNHYGSTKAKVKIIYTRARYRHKIKRKYKSHKVYAYKIKKESFHYFCAKQIIKRVRYLKRTASHIEYQDIAIIMDYYEKLHSLTKKLHSLTNESSSVNLNHDPLKKLKAHLQKLNFKGGNAVTMCYSDEIASLEWPIVFHIQHTDLCNAKDKDKISFIQSDHGLIISRCMAYFIHICCSHPDSFTNKSFGEKFNGWYHKQQNHKKPLDEAVKEYCREDSRS